MKANWISSVWFAYNYGRPCDMSRVQEIVRQKKDVPLFPGVISVFEFPPHVPISIAVPQVKQIVPRIEGCEGDVWILCVLKLDWHPGTKLVVIRHEQNNLTRESRVLWCWQTRAIFDGQHRCLAIHAILQVHREIVPKFFPVMLTEAWQKMLKKM